MKTNERSRLFLSLLLVGVLAFISGPVFSGNSASVFAESLGCDLTTGFDDPNEPREDGLTLDQVVLVCLYKEVNNEDIDIQSIDDDYDVIDHYESNRNVDLYDSSVVSLEITKLILEYANKEPEEPDSSVVDRDSTVDSDLDSVIETDPDVDFDPFDPKDGEESFLSLGTKRVEVVSKGFFKGAVTGARQHLLDGEFLVPTPYKAEFEGYGRKSVENIVYAADLTIKGAKHGLSVVREKTREVWSELKRRVGMD